MPQVEPYPAGYLSYAALSFKRKHTCEMCRVEFEDYSGITKFCAECRVSPGRAAAKLEYRRAYFRKYHK